MGGFLVTDSTHHDIADRALAVASPLRIVVLGGGSAGWLVAGYLATLGRQSSVRQLTVTLVESDTIARIGVGEATVPSIRGTLSLLGLREEDFINEADATYKQAIEFVGWSTGTDEDAFFHPFDKRPVAIPDTSLHRWLNSDRAIRWDHYISPQSRLCSKNYSPKADAPWPDYASPLPYAYHMDADGFGHSLRQHFAQNGVNHIVATVKHVELEPVSGNITSLQTEDGQEIAGDLFIDCSGMRGQLIDKTLGVGYQSLSDKLLCDRAVALRVPLTADEAQRPYTRSVAMSSGWRWEIPLRSRLGTGYVYSSAHCSREAAEQDLRAQLGARADGVPARHLSFDVGYREAFWSRNVIAMGMAGGFIEPLESTAIYLVEAAASLLCTMLPQGPHHTVFAQHFNRSMSQLYEEVTDFVNFHYVMSNRQDTDFWRDASDPARATENVRGLMALWLEKPPTVFDFPYPFRLFSPQSYEHILFGMKTSYPCGMTVNARLCEPLPETEKAVKEGLAGFLPTNRALAGFRTKGEPEHA